LKLDPDFEEAKLRKYAVLCHNRVEKALKAQHDTLQKTLEELQGYQKQQELWLHYQQKLLSEQAPPGTLLEQRLHYREYKIREIIDSTNRGKNGAQILHSARPPVSQSTPTAWTPRKKVFAINSVDLVIYWLHLNWRFSFW